MEKEMKFLQVRIRASDHTKLKILAAQVGRPMTDLVGEFIAAYIKVHEKNQAERHAAARESA